VGVRYKRINVNSTDWVIDVNNAVDYIMARLKDHVYIHYEATTTNSVYLKCYDERMGSIRVSDHEGKPYSYTWNIRLDKKGVTMKNENGVLRRYYGLNVLKRFIVDFKNELEFDESKVIEL